MPVSVPDQWPKEVSDKYEPVRSLGKGGFASVMLGKRKDPTAKPKFAAIKVVGSKDVTRQEVGYAHREIDILSELNHPNIMKVLEHWEPPVKDHRCAAIMALSFHKGPTLDQLLKKGGSLSNVFGRVVCAQLVDVLAFIHSRAVLHRDIKPDNMIISGAAYELDEIWDEIIVESEVTDWSQYTKKWTLTMVDFGFARALTPDDMAANKAPSKAPPKKRASSGLDNSTRSGGSSIGASRKSLGRSISRAFNRQMSALGNRGYAAPEILEGVKPNSNHGALARGATGDDSVHLTNNLGPGISNYGMMVDAYSCGNTVRFAMTGVPPNQDIEKSIASQDSPKLGCCGGGGGKGKDGKPPRKVKYRSLDEIPKEAARLIDGLTQVDADKRTSIRQARMYPWIDNALSTDTPGQEVQYLSFTMEEEKPGGISATEE